MKRIMLATLAVGAVTLVGIGLGINAATSGQSQHGRGSFDGDGYAGDYDGGKGWGRWRGRGRGMRHRGMRRHGMRRMMRRFDADKDGKLTQDEINSGRRALITKHDGDGNGQLSLAEYQNLWLEIRRRRMVRGFQRFDKDGDAVITTEEFLEPFSRIVARMDRNDDGVLDKQDRRRFGMRHQRRGFGKDGERRRDGKEPEDDGAEQ